MHRFSVPAGPFLLSLILIQLIALPNSARANSEDPPPEIQRFEALRETLSAGMVARLEPLAEECRKVKLFGLEDTIHEVLIGCDPGHKYSRRALGYYHSKGKGWVRSKSYRPGRDFGTEADLELMQARLEAELIGFRSGMLAEVGKTLEASGTAAAWRQLERLSEVLPRDTVVRDLLGEVLVDGEWELIESVRARKRRAAYPSLARACVLQAPEPDLGSIRQEEQQLGLPWNAARKTSDVRVLGTTGDDEVSYAARVSHAMGDFVRYTLCVDERHREDFTIYMLSLANRGQLLDAWPKLSIQTRKALMQADGGWLDAGNRLAEWSANPARRIDGAARQTLGTLMIDAFGIDGRHAWAWEGVGLYLVHEVVGTRLTWFFHPDGYAPQGPTGLWTRLQNPETNWFHEATVHLSGPDATSLVYLLGRKINEMREADVLHSYVLAAYLLEGHPQAVPIILQRIGTGHHPVLVFEEELGMPVPTIEKRLLRWIRETQR